MENLAFMMTTKGFIESKCKKDHLQPPKNSLASRKKCNSIYSTDYKTTEMSETTEASESRYKKLLKIINLPSKQPRNEDSKQKVHIIQMKSNYRQSFESHVAVAASPVKIKQKESYFLKENNYEPPQSVYKLMSALEKNKDIYLLEKGKPRSDNLGVPKYSKMRSTSMYRLEYDKHVRLPLIIKAAASKPE